MGGLLCFIWMIFMQALHTNENTEIVVNYSLNHSYAINDQQYVVRLRCLVNCRLNEGNT